MVVQHSEQVGKVKKFSKCAPHELTENKKNHCLEVSSLMLCNNNEPFLNRTVTCDERRFYTTTSDNQLEAPKHFPEPSLHQKKVMIIWQSAACLIHYYFLNLDKSLHLRSIFSKLMRCTKNCNACIQHWPTERAKFFFTTTPDLTPHCKTNA